MTQSKRQYGSGCLIKRGSVYAIRWREMVIGPDGAAKRALRYETLGEVTRKEASHTLTQKLAAAYVQTTPTRSVVSFRSFVAEWDATVVPMYKHSTQGHHRQTVRKHLLPQFGDKRMCDITRQEIQRYVAALAAKGYAPKTVDHIHDVMSAILRTAVKWGHMTENVAHGVDLPKLRCVKPKWALTTRQAAELISELPPLARTMVALDILTGLRRGELFALRWKDIDENTHTLTVNQAVYKGKISTPKTEAGLRQIPLSNDAWKLLMEWKGKAEDSGPDSLVFSTKVSTTLCPNNLLRRAVFPVCKRMGIPDVTWLTCRRTYSSWSHAMGVPGKVIAQLMGHSNVDTTLNVYTQVLDGSVRAAVEKVSEGLFTKTA